MSQRYNRFLGAPSQLPSWGRRCSDSPDILEVMSGAPWKPTSVLTGERIELSRVQLLAPAEPTKILALAYNYRDLFADKGARARSDEPHYSDLGFEPLIFLKGPNCISQPNGNIELPADGQETWVEVEVTAVIGKRARNLRTTSAARDAVFGLTIANDMTALNVLGRDWHLARSKSLDGFCPVGPDIVTDFDDSDVPLRTWINGRQTQSSVTKNRILDTYEAVMFASRIMTLEPGDLILTGTPAGARQSLVKSGDIVEMEIEGLGRLRNTFTSAPI
jgi:2-keto-4-pentenoate hydratase/2-oxohepta-3-ene-1,7-dioic acid hydratase in catechol pathway